MLTSDQGCVDLREIAKAKRWRWRYEESYKAERNADARGDGRWYVELACRRGTIYPHGGDELAASVSRPAVLRELLALGDDVKVHQRGDLEATVRFPAALLDQVAGVLKPRRVPPGNMANLTMDGRAAGLAALGNLLCGSRGNDDLGPGRPTRLS
jgi:hypothetical protein